MTTNQDPALQAILDAYLRAAADGQAPDRDELLRRHPEFTVGLQEFFARLDASAWPNADPLVPSAEGASTAAIRASPDGTGDFPASRASVPAPGRAIGGYDLLEELARGGMGVVFKARQRSLNRIVALKMILAGPWASPGEVRRFRTEAEAVALLDHPHIVPIYEVGEEDGRPFFSMKLMEGGPLDRRMADLRADPRRAVRLVATAARAVHHAHQRGILHRDLKPGNILLDMDGSPFVCDFGLAKQVQPANDVQLADPTQSGAILGTPSYMAPEQARGEKGLSIAVDVYALGAILYECLTGRPPFRADTPMETILHVLEREPPRPRSLNASLHRDLETICLKCLDKEPARRYGSAAELSDDLERWLVGEPIRARRAGIVERGAKWARRQPVVAGLLAFVLVGTVFGFAVALGQYHDAQEARREAALRADREADAKDQARHALDHAENDLYFAFLTLAEREWQDGHPDRARMFLDQCPLGLRHWEWYHHDRVGRAELLNLVGHQAGVNLAAVAFNPDGTRLAAPAGEGIVNVWDARTGRLLVTLSGHGGLIGGLAWSHDGKRLAVGSEDRFVRLWDLSGDPTVVKLGPNAGMVFAVAFHPKSGELAAGVGDLHEPSKPGEVVVWNLAERRVSRKLTGHKGTVYTVAYSPDGSRLASGSDDMTAIVWDAGTGVKQRALMGHAIDTAARGGARVLRVRGPGGAETTIRLFNAAVFGVAFSPNGKRLATAGGDGTLRLWDLTDGKEAFVLRGHREPVCGVAFSPDGKMVASGSLDGSARLWSATTGRELRRYLGNLTEVSAVAFSPPLPDGGLHLAAAGDNGTVKVWDANQFQDSYTWRGQRASVFGLAFAPDSRSLAAGSGDLFNPLKAGDIRIFDPVARRELFRLPSPAGGIGTLAYSPNGKWLASGCADGTVEVWDLATRRSVRSFRVAKGTVSYVAFSPDGATLAAASGMILFPGEAGEVKLWDVASGVEKQVFRGHGGSVTCLAYSPDGKYLASGSTDKTVKVWDVVDGRELRTLRGHSSPLLTVAFSPDGSQLAAGGGDVFWPTKPGTVQVWNVGTGEIVLTLTGHTQMVNRVAYLPDGERLATSSRDGTVKLWQTRTGRQVLSLRGGGNYVCGMAISPDGHWIASGNWNNSVSLWEGRAAE